MKTIIKKMFTLFVYSYSSILCLRKPKRLIVCYHRICEKKNKLFVPHLSSNFLDIASFERQIRWLCSFATPRSLNDIFLYMNSPCKNWEFSITFDDGYRDVIELGLPVLKRYGVPMTAFLNSHFVFNRQCIPWSEIVNQLIAGYRGEIHIRIGGKSYTYDMSSQDERVRFAVDTPKWFRELGSQECKELRRQLRDALEEAGIEVRNDVMSREDILSSTTSGLVEYGGHSASHVNLAKCDDDELRYEIIHERRKLSEMISDDVRFFSYPYGKKHYRSTDAIDCVRKAGYLSAYTIDPYYLVSGFGVYELPRIAINGDWDLMTFKARILGAGMFRLREMLNNFSRVIMS